MPDIALLRATVQEVSGKTVPADDDESLFDSGVLDSFTLTDLVAALETKLNVKIPDSDVNPRKFESVTRISAYLADRGV